MPRPLDLVGADAEEAEVVVVVAVRQAQEGRPGAGLAGGDLHPEDGRVEVDRPLEVGDEEDGVVEPDCGDGRVVGMACSLRSTTL